MRQATLTVPAPAKLNLFLHVTGRRPDGYHTLESLMVLLDFGDTLTLSRRKDGAIVLENPLPGVPVESDLTWRAAKLLQDQTGTATGATIALTKRIPMGAGLGGGSSDAASVLLGLNRLWQLDLPRGELMRLGLQLGADVPFFLSGANAHMTGIGEILRPVTVPRMAYLIVVPPVHVATAGIFASPELKRDTPASGAAAFPFGFGGNDLQAVATASHPAIATAIRALDMADFAGAGHTTHAAARLSGSGSAVFCVLDRGLPGSEAAWRAAGASRRADWKLLQGILHRSPRLHDAAGKAVDGSRVIPARGLNHHPLRDFAAK